MDIKSKRSFRDIRVVCLQKNVFFRPLRLSCHSISCHPLVTTYLNNVTKARQREKSYSPPILREGQVETLRVDKFDLSVGGWDDIISG